MTNQPETRAALTWGSITDAIATVTEAQEDLRPLFDVIEEMQGRPDVAAAVARSAKLYLDKAEKAFEEVVEFCRKAVMERIEREKLAADFEEPDQVRALRDLSREWARKAEQLTAPAMRAITHMQKGAGQFDDMIERARALAGCYRPIYPADRDPNKPPSGSLRATVEDAMGVAPGSLGALSQGRHRMDNAAERSEAYRAADRGASGSSGVSPP